MTEKLKPCPCIEFKIALSDGVTEMQKEKAPKIIIGDYVRDMINGDWIGCEGCGNKRKEGE